MVALSTALGLASIELADAASRDGYSYSKASVPFWIGLLLIFVPITGRALMRNADRRERLILVIMLGVAFYLVKVLANPATLMFIDEPIYLRGTEDILRTHHLFQVNPLLPTASYYPGLTVVTAGLIDLSGLSPFTSAILIMGVARVLCSACFFLVAEKVTDSDRAAAGASLVYAANPMFLFWSASFSYEDLALPLAAFALWWLGRTRHETGRPTRAAVAAVIVAVVVTHHVVGLALAALLCTWWLVERLNGRQRPARREVGIMALVAVATALVWLFFVAQPAVSYLFGENILPALRQTASLLAGHTAPRHLYSSGGVVAPLWQTLAGFAAVALLLLALPPALYLAWRRRDRAPTAVAILVAAAYPLSLAPRLAPDGVAISGRSSEYIFFGLGCVLGLLAKGPDWTRGRHLRRAVRVSFFGPHRTAVAAAVVTTMFIGGVTIGTAFYQQLPEASHPKGYPWSAQPGVISASRWALQHLGVHLLFGANAIDAAALAAYGEEDPVPEGSVWPVFFAEKMDGAVVHTIRALRVRYLLVNWQMTKGVPPTPGYYFTDAEPGAGGYTNVFPATGLQKFASTACSVLVYHSGFIDIFDVTRIENGTCVPGTASAARDQRRPL